ncbi:carbohydrate ABC transporter permease [Nostocoides sp. F2B08]|uniref:carbohydrate ABC transporter permease n=1 Tax=Nostocoides sp. F2B08 TaxID=2653936 RepID=UPI00351A9A0A
MAPLSDIKSPERAGASTDDAEARAQTTPVSKSALAVGIVMILVFVGVVGIIAASFFSAVPEISWPSFLVDSSTTLEKLGLMTFVVLLFVGVMALLLFMVDSRKRVPNWTVAIAFVGPALAALLLGLIWPGVSTIIQSFYGRSPWSDPERSEFVGFDNFATLFTTSEFQVVLRNTMIWVILVPLVAVGLGLLYAVLIDRTRGEAVSKGLIFLPMAISLVGASIIWRFIYEYRAPARPQIGLANQILIWLGLDPYQFLLNSPWNTVFLIVVMVWIQTGFAMTIISAAIKAIPDDIIEAARLDGVSGLRMFRYVTIPSIRPALLVVWVTITMTTLKVFDIVRTMTGGNFQTSVVANEFYTQSFRQFDFGLGAALAVLLFVIVIPVVVYQVRQLRLSEDIR